jgi:hypothetical protein
MLALKIDKGVPIPTSTVRQGVNVSFLKSMEPGDSVFFDKDNIKKATRFYRVAKRLEIKIIIRREGDGMRMWRCVNTAPIDQEVQHTYADEKEKAVDRASDPKPAKIKAVKAAKAKKKLKVKKVEDKAAKAARDKAYREKKKAEKAAAAETAAQKVVQTTGQVLPNFGTNLEPQS